MSKIPRRPYPGLGSALGLLGVGMAILVGLGWLAGRLFRSQVPDLVVLEGILNLVVLGPLAAFGYWRSGELPQFSRLEGLRAGYPVGLALAAAGGTVVLGEAANLVAWVIPMSPNLTAVFNTLTEDSPLASLFTLALVAPLTEEALFRGLLLRGFVRRYGVVPGLVLSSALFGLFHLNVWQAVPAFLAGLFLGWVYLTTRNLLYPMAVHGLFNGLPVVLGALGLSVTGYNTPTVAGSVEFQPVPWVAGAAVVLAAGLWLTKRLAPLSPPMVSDTLEP